MSKCSLSDIAEIIMGQSPKGDTCNLNGIGKPLLNGPTEFGDFYPISKQYTTNGKKLSIKGDILFCVRGSTTGRMNWSDKEYVLGRGLASIRHKKGEKLNHFLKYLIDINLNSILKITSGSTFPNLTKDMLNSFKVVIPNDIQAEKINGFLKDLDAKIELNNKINQELEAMAKTLYDYWFVQFDFPNEQGKPYKSSGGKMVYNEELKREIPEGWEVKELGTFAQIKKGTLITEKTADTDGNIKVISAGINYSYFHSKANYSSNTITISASGANAGFVNFWREPIFACDCTTVRGKSEAETLIILDFLKMRQEYLFSQARGSAQPHVYPKDVEALKIVVPTKDLIISFGDKTVNTNKRIANNIKQNQQLTALRDWLLPMLMNGQVRVGEAEEKLSMAAEPSVEYKKG